MDRTPAPQADAPFRTFWFGVGVILLAAVLNLMVAAVVVYAPAAIPAKLLASYDDRKPVLTFAVVGVGLVLVLRDALLPLAGRQVVAAADGTAEFALILRDGGVPLVTSQYLRSKGKRGE